MIFDPRHCIWFAVTWGTKSDKNLISTDSTHARNIFLYGLKQKVWLSTNQTANVLVTLSGTKIWTTPQRLLLTVNSPPKRQLPYSACRPAHWENGAVLESARNYPGVSDFARFSIWNPRSFFSGKEILYPIAMKPTSSCYFNHSGNILI